MSFTWGDLREELSHWRDEGRSATFWWRDDDAVDVTPQLERLLSQARRCGVRPALAVIPKLVTESLQEHLEVHDCDVVQHGYSHSNHAPPDQKTMELGAHRPATETLRELSQGWEVVQRFAQAQPVMVPPWNRINEHVVAGLAALGFVGLSTFGAREHVAQHKLRVVNTHIDPIAWRGGRGFVGESAALAQVVGHLEGRRLRRVDSDEPTGLMTHHLVQDDDCWSFCERLFEETRAAGGEWLGTVAAFDLAR